jgi:hypothetical protein
VHSATSGLENIGIRDAAERLTIDGAAQFAILG